MGYDLRFFGRKGGNGEAVEQEEEEEEELLRPNDRGAGPTVIRTLGGEGWGLAGGDVEGVFGFVEVDVDGFAVADLAGEEASG